MNETMGSGERTWARRELSKTFDGLWDGQREIILRPGWRLVSLMRWI